MDSFDKMKVHMSLKIHFLNQHVDFFKDNLGKISDEHGERFHQQIKNIERRFQGKEIKNMLAEYVWQCAMDDEDEKNTEKERERETQRTLRSSRLQLLQLHD